MANFSFKLDGQVDMMSLNPLEMTNFEMVGALFGIMGILITLYLSRKAAARQRPHEFIPQETDEDAVG
ncbi:hypothetical protein M2341_002353 [Sphingobium sp. B7D2B]|uniref:hypothetical protein n=1 Tax=Sphingobium sp. B7D2B TaxID=2940583 RepID=UPI00222579BF|nr:hypothetical protein [Sphingobium sp. B7D2B]MCW2366906.1 hypothetical protein [Sphingobium sp. B7D2B]